MQVFMMYANRTEEDILLRAELDALSTAHPQKLHILHVLSQPKEGTKIAHSKGRVTSAIMQAHIPNGTEEGVFALLCGPQGFLDEACLPGLRMMGYAPEKCITF